MRRKMLLLRFFVLFIAVFNIASCWEDYENPVDYDDDGVWSNNDAEDDALIAGHRGRPYTAFRTNELALFSKKTDVNPQRYYSCIQFNPDNHQCNVSVLRWKELDSPDFYGHDFIRKIDMSVVAPFEKDKIYMFQFDTSIYGYPWTYFIHDNSSGFKLSMIPDRAVHANSYTDPTVIFDKEDPCNEHRPKYGEFKGADVMSIALYLNFKAQEYITYPYLFFKNESNICVYRFNFPQIRMKVPIAPAKVYTINNYPTEGYAPKFFAVDPLYGTFVSIYWNGQRESPPEVHFFAFNENEPNNLQRIYKFTLTGFDQDVLADIYSGNYDDDAQPQFHSYGRQIFLSFKRKGAAEEFACLWSGENATEFTPLSRPVDNFIKLWHVRHDYIQIWKPVKPFDSHKEFNENVTSATLAPEIESTSTMLVQETSTSMPEFVENSTLPDSEKDHHGGHENGEAASANDDVNNGSFAQCLESPMLWLFVLFVLLDVVAVVALIIVIIFERRGAKKLKDSGLKKSQKGAQKKNHSKVAASGIAAASTTAKPEPKKAAKKKGKKSEKEKTSATKSVDQESSIKSKMTTADPSKYFTVDTSLRHGTKK